MLQGQVLGGGEVRWKKVHTAKQNVMKVWLGLARHKVDVVVVQGRTGKHGAVWVEGCAGNGGGTLVMKEARVGLKGGEVCAVDIVGLDFVAVCAPVREKKRGLVIEC